MLFPFIFSSNGSLICRIVYTEIPKLSSTATKNRSNQFLCLAICIQIHRLLKSDKLILFSFFGKDENMPKGHEKIMKMTFDQTTSQKQT
ncbi:hypothetical protein Hanom_Chr12g01154971 [Helianthus anomalus]